MELRPTFRDALLPSRPHESHWRVALAKSRGAADWRAARSGNGGKPLRLYGLSASGWTQRRAAQPDFQHPFAWRVNRRCRPSNRSPGSPDDAPGDQRGKSEGRTCRTVTSRRPFQSRTPRKRVREPYRFLEIPNSAQAGGGIPIATGSIEATRFCFRRRTDAKRLAPLATEPSVFRGAIVAIGIPLPLHGIGISEKALFTGY